MLVRDFILQCTRNIIIYVTSRNHICPPCPVVRTFVHICLIDAVYLAYWCCSPPAALLMLSPNFPSFISPIRPNRKTWVINNDNHLVITILLQQCCHNHPSQPWYNHLVPQFRVPTFLNLIFTVSGEENNSCWSSKPQLTFSSSTRESAASVIPEWPQVRSVAVSASLDDIPDQPELSFRDIVSKDYISFRDIVIITSEFDANSLSNNHIIWISPKCYHVHFIILFCGTTVIANHAPNTTPTVGVV